jgi:Zn-dependent protease with chaperone function
MASRFDLPKGLKHFPGLSGDDFMHPLDRDALNMLKQIPVLDQVINFINQQTFERYLYLMYVSSSVRINERMLPQIYEKFRWAMKILDLEETLEAQGKPEPELYVTQDPIPNAITAGTDQTFIVLHSSIVNGFNDKDLLYVIGHELGHIKAGHVLYKTIAMIVLMLIQKINIPSAELLKLPLMEWMRKAELTSDRAGALCVQDSEACQAVHMKLASGVWSMFDQMDLDEFIKQVDLYTDRSEHLMDLFSKVILTMARTHPFPIFRAKELREWMAGYDYERLMMRGHSNEKAGATR